MYNPEIVCTASPATTDADFGGYLYDPCFFMLSLISHLLPARFLHLLHGLRLPLEATGQAREKARHTASFHF